MSWHSKDSNYVICLLKLMRWRRALDQVPKGLPSFRDHWILPIWLLTGRIEFLLLGLVDPQKLQAWYLIMSPKTLYRKIPSSLTFPQQNQSILNDLQLSRGVFWTTKLTAFINLQYKTIFKKKRRKLQSSWDKSVIHFSMINWRPSSWELKTLSSKSSWEDMANSLISSKKLGMISIWHYPEERSSLS